jgi:hypothetical protein
MSINSNNSTVAATPKARPNKKLGACTEKFNANSVLIIVEIFMGPVGLVL